MIWNPGLCWLANSLGWYSETALYTSPGGFVTITVCERCESYRMETHGYRFAGRIWRMPDDFKRIALLLDTAGYAASCVELRRLSTVMQDSVAVNSA